MGRWNVLELMMGRAEGCTAMGMYVVTLSCALNGWDGELHVICTHHRPGLPETSPPEQESCKPLVWGAPCLGN